MWINLTKEETVSTGFSGLKVELVVSERCNECGKRIINQSALLVCRYRGTQAALPTLYYHEECLFKSTMELHQTKKGKCPICNGTQGNDFRFKNQFDERYTYKYGSYHERCVRKVIDLKSDLFGQKDIEFEKAMKNFEVGNYDVSKIRKVTQLDSLFVYIKDLDTLEKCLSSSKKAKERFIRKQHKHPLFKQYITKHYKDILRHNISKWKSWETNDLYEFHELVTSVAKKQWKMLSITEKDEFVSKFPSYFSSVDIKEDWEQLSEETKQVFCKYSEFIDYDFFLQSIANQEKLLVILRNNYHIKNSRNEKVYLDLYAEEKVLSKVW